MATAAFVVSLLLAAYLVTLGACALLRPELARRFLGALGSSARHHYTEVALRLVAGAALVANAPHMRLGGAVAIFGWVVLGTTLGMAVIPWRVHQRFAVKAVPLVFRFLPLVGVVAMAGGLALFAALVLPHAE